ncbi:MAG: glutamine synthetase, partial [Lautropia sp.]|nr:glutamine synthetase [Lautropia sp.]
LYLASQVYAGLDGIGRALPAPRATDAPYADSHERLPTGLEEALAALESDPVLCAAFGESFIRYFTRIKRCELVRYDAAQDKLDFQRRKYFSRI